MKQHNHPVVIVKKRKAGHGGHHGGSWKIAYADFMTAMMAFFLVMWLLSIASPRERALIAEYFKMPLKVALTDGPRISHSETPIPGGGTDLEHTEGEVKKSSRDKQREEARKRDRSQLKKTREELEKLLRNDPRLRELRPNLRLTMLDGGLRIQIIDSNNRPMFKVGSAQPEPYMRDILHAITPVLNDTPNKITLSGHTDDLPYAAGEKSYSNWELSSDRANASRREMSLAGLKPGKVMRVVGMADTVKVKGESSDHARNRRISIMILTKEKEQSIREEDNTAEELSLSLDNESDALGQLQKMKPAVAPAAKPTAPAPAVNAAQ